MRLPHTVRTKGLWPLLSLACLALAACSTPQEQVHRSQLNPERMELAVAQVEALQTSGRRVWCVPFARNLSGIEIRGNARTWWHQAEGRFPRQADPELGAVMAFKATSRNPHGHVAVVSNVLNDREILVDHANWSRNQISVAMRVVDVSKTNNWSAVRLESTPNNLGRVYPVQGFILPSARTE